MCIYIQADDTHKKLFKKISPRYLYFLMLILPQIYSKESKYSNTSGMQKKIVLKTLLQNISLHVGLDL